MGNATKAPVTAIVKNLGDTNLETGEIVSLLVIRKRAKKGQESGELAFRFGLVDTDRRGNPMPAFRFVNAPKNLVLKEGDEYHAKIVGVKRSGQKHNIRGTEREAIRVFATDFVRHERYSEIREVGNSLIRVVYCGDNIVRREIIPARIVPQRYRLGAKIVNTVEVLVGNQVVLRRLNHKQVPQGLILEKFFNLLPELSEGQYKTLGRYYGTFENMKVLYANSLTKGRTVVTERKQPHAEATA